MRKDSEEYGRPVMMSFQEEDKNYDMVMNTSYFVGIRSFKMCQLAIIYTSDIANVPVNDGVSNCQGVDL